VDYSLLFLMRRKLTLQKYFFNNKYADFIASFGHLVKANIQPKYFFSILILLNTRLFADCKTSSFFLTHIKTPFNILIPQRSRTSCNTLIYRQLISSLPQNKK